MTANDCMVTRWGDEYDLPKYPVEISRYIPDSVVSRVPVLMKLWGEDGAIREFGITQVFAVEYAAKVRGIAW